MVVAAGGALVPLLFAPARAAVTAASTATAPPTQTAPPSTPNPASVNVRVGKAWVSQPVAPGFIGFSFEFTAVRDYTGSDPRAINPVLVALIRDVAPGQTPVLRIGGNSTDGTWWPLPGVTPSPGITYTLTKSWLATTRALAVETGAKLILGVNLKDDSAAEAAAETYAYRTGIGAKHIEALEIGNEPELYKVFPWYEINGEPFYARPPIYNFTSYTAGARGDRRASSGLRARRPGDRHPAVVRGGPAAISLRAPAEGRHLPPLSVARLLLGSRATHAIPRSRICSTRTPRAIC